MELEVVRAVSAGLQDATIGINAMIDALTLDTLGDPRPSHVSVYNYFDHDWVAEKTLNIEEARNAKIALPGLAVYLDQAPTYDAEVMTSDHRDGDFPVAVSWLTYLGTPTEKRRQASMINRALLRFFTLFHSNDYKDTLRLRNDVSLMLAKVPITQYTPLEPWGELTLAAQTAVLYRVREHRP